MGGICRVTNPEDSRSLVILEKRSLGSEIRRDLCCVAASGLGSRFLTERNDF